jgi:hypothetical protein
VQPSRQRVDNPVDSFVRKESAYNQEVPVPVASQSGAERFGIDGANYGDVQSAKVTGDERFGKFGNREQAVCQIDAAVLQKQFVFTTTQVSHDQCFFERSRDNSAIATKDGQGLVNVNYIEADQQIPEQG